MELYFLLQSLFGSKFYCAFGYLFFSSLVVTITTALTSVLSTYVHLCSENYQLSLRLSHRFIPFDAF